MKLVECLPLKVYSYTFNLSFRNSALHMAVFSGKIDMVDLLIQSKAKVGLSFVSLKPTRLHCAVGSVSD